MMTLSVGFPAISAAFLAALVEAVEAVTIVLAVATVRGWRSAGAGALAGFVVLALLVLIPGPLLECVPLRSLQLAIGVLLLLFGMRWLRKAVLRAVGIIPPHDEQIIFERESALLRDYTHHTVRLDWIAARASFKTVLLEGLEVVFIVLAVGADHGLLRAASLGGAMAAWGLIIAICWTLRRPLVSVPENSLKFGVGIMLSAFGVFWTGEGLGIPWPGGDLAIPGIAVLFLLAALATIEFVRRPGAGVQP
jgi:uncharacterized membrane protein